MDWQTFLVTHGQTVVITTGCALGFLAIAAYRVKARWGMFAEDRQHEREQSEDWIWETFDAENARSGKTEKEWTWGN